MLKIADSVGKQQTKRLMTLRFPTTLRRGDLRPQFHVVISYKCKSNITKFCAPRQWTQL